MNLKVYTCLSKHTQPYQLFLHRHCFELSGGYIASQVSPPLSQGRGDKHCGVFGMEMGAKSFVCISGESMIHFKIHYKKLRFAF